MNKIERESLVAKYYQLFNNEQYDQMLALVHPELVHEVNQGIPQVGKQKFAHFLTHMQNCYAEKLKNIEIMGSEHHPRIAAEFIVDGEYLKTDGSLPAARNQKYKIKAGAFFDFKDGLISRVTTHYNLPEWIKLVQTA